MGKRTIYNVLCTLDMLGAIPDGSANLGNMESEASGTADIYVFFETLDMTADNTSTGSNSNTEKYGISNDTMAVTYEEDEYGQWVLR